LWLEELWRGGCDFGWRRWWRKGWNSWWIWVVDGGGEVKVEEFGVGENWS